MRFSKVTISLLLLSSLIIGLISFFSFSIPVKALPDQFYTFDDNVILDAETDPTSNPFNLRAVSEYTEIYNATYSFTNEIEGTSGTNINFVDIVDLGGGSVLINDSVGNHANVIELNDTDNTEDTLITNNFLEGQVASSIEFWIRATTVTVDRTFMTLDSSISVIIDSNKFQFNNGSLQDVGLSAVGNRWYHMRFVFDCNLDTYEIWIDKIQYQDSVAFLNVADTLNSFSIFTRNSDFNYKVYLDGVGYLWQNTTLDFESDIIGNEPEGWTSNNIGNTQTIVRDISNTQQLALIDEDAFEECNIRRSIKQTPNQRISFDVSIDTIVSNQGFQVRFRENISSTLVRLRISNDDFESFDGVVWNSVKNNFITINTSFTVSFILNDSVNTFDIFIDDVLEGNDMDYSDNSVISIDEILLLTDASGQNQAFVDNITIGSGVYNRGDNLIPFLNVSQNLQEVNRYEFALTDVNTFNGVGADNPNGWTDQEVPSGDKVGITPEVDGSFDRLIIVDTNVIGDVRGIQRINFDIGGDFVNVTFGIIPAIMDGVVNTINLNLFSSDSSNVGVFIFKANLDFIYSDGGAPVTLTTFTLNDRIELNVLINYEIDQGFIVLSANSVVFATATYLLPTLGKVGLRSVGIATGMASADTLRYFIDYIGIYDKGLSQVVPNDDFGLSHVSLHLIHGISNWSIQNNNLLTIKANGTFHLGAIEDFYFNGATLFTLKDTAVYDNTTQIINIYDVINSTVIIKPQILMTIFPQTFFDISSLKIDGVVLNESDNSYNLIFEHSGVDTNESFFFVDGDKLRFTHIANDTNSELIQARFNIEDVSSDGFSLSFLSQATDNAFSFIRVNFTEVSNFVQFPVVEKTTRFILAQNLTIRDFIVLVTDRNDDTVSGLTSGFISEIQLLETANISVSIITLSLIGMLIPLLLIMIPTLALANPLGRKFIVPLFIFMSVVSVATNLIPIWLFFTIAFSSLLFFTDKRSVEDGI